MSEPCKHCGCCGECERCNCCGHCKKCGKAMPLPAGYYVWQYIPVYQPYIYPTTTGVIYSGDYSTALISGFNSGGSTSGTNS